MNTLKKGMNQMHYSITKHNCKKNAHFCLKDFLNTNVFTKKKKILKMKIKTRISHI